MICVLWKKIRLTCDQTLQLVIFHHNTSVAITMEYISSVHYGSSAHSPVLAEVTAQG